MNGDGLTMDEVRAVRERHRLANLARSRCNAEFHRRETAKHGHISVAHRKTPLRYGAMADWPYVGCRGRCVTGVKHFSV